MYRLNKCGSCASRGKIDSAMLEHIANQRSILNSEKTCNNQREISNDNSSCECDKNYDAEIDYSLAMVYSPYQKWQNLYCLEEGFKAGTIFKELDKPFYGPKCGGGMCNE